MASFQAQMLCVFLVVQMGRWFVPFINHIHSHSRKEIIEVTHRQKKIKIGISSFAKTLK